MHYSFFFFFSSRRRHTRSLRDWSSDVCSSDLVHAPNARTDAVGDGHATLIAQHQGQRGTGGGVGRGQRLIGITRRSREEREPAHGCATLPAEPFSYHPYTPPSNRP